MRVFDKQLFSKLNQDALESPRNRSHLNLHSNFEEKVQRLFISLVQGSFVEPHYHDQPNQWEMFIVLEGVIEVILYNNEGESIKQFLVGEGQGCQTVELEPFEIHSVKCISDKALMLEIKEGPFNPYLAKVMVDFGGEE